MKYKLKKSRSEVLERATRAVELARQHCDEVEFSAEDASRSDPDFLYEIFEAVISAGATIINVPDTVGYALPWEYGELIAGIRKHVPNIDQAQLSVHCQDRKSTRLNSSHVAISYAVFCF